MLTGIFVSPRRAGAHFSETNIAIDRVGLTVSCLGYRVVGYFVVSTMFEKLPRMIGG